MNKAKKCQVCAKSLPPPGPRKPGRERKYCSRRCTNAAAKRAYLDRVRAGYEPKGRLFFDETGNRYGLWTVIRRGENLNEQPGWVCRCEGCGTERLLRAGHLRSGNSTGCVRCAGARASARHGHPASVIEGARRDVCSWCKRPAASTANRAGVRTAYECEACNRRARRNGRDESGRPLYRNNAYSTRPRVVSA